MVAMGRPRKYEFDDDEAIRLYKECGNASKVAKKLGVNRGAVLRLVKTHGLKINKPHARRKFSEKEEKEMVSMYEGGMSQSEIAKEKGLSQVGVGKILGRQNVSMRKTKAKMYGVNEDLFNVIDSEEKAYWLGFLAADGWISKEKVIGLCLHEKDKQHVVKFCEFVGLDKSRVHSGSSRNEVYVSFKSVKVWNDLLKKGFTTNKSHDLDKKVVECVPTDLRRHFWRGMIDGDGSLGYHRDHYPVISLVGTESIVNEFKLFLEKKGIRTAKIHEYNEGSWFSVSCWGVEVNKTKKLLYKDQSISLKRKEDIAMSDMLPSEGIAKIGQVWAKDFLGKYHYLKTLPVASMCFGWFLNDKLVGVAAVGYPTSRGFESKYGKNVVELRRFALSNHKKNLGSKFLSRVIKELKREGRYDTFIAYADMAQGHEGIIYKAVKMVCDKEVKRQLVGVVGIRRLTGIHLQWYIEQNGISGLKFEESPGKKRYVLDLK